MKPLTFLFLLLIATPTLADTSPKQSIMPSISELLKLSRDFNRELRMKQLLSKEEDIGNKPLENKHVPYIRTLIRVLKEKWRLPKDLIMDKLTPNERKLDVVISIGLTGQLLGVKILQPSPSSELNKSVKSAVYKAVPFTPLPSSWGLKRANFFLCFESSKETSNQNLAIKPKCRVI